MPTNSPGFTSNETLSSARVMVSREPYIFPICLTESNRRGAVFGRVLNQLRDYERKPFGIGDHRRLLRNVDSRGHASLYQETRPWATSAQYAIFA